MTHVAYNRHVAVAKDHLGDSAPTNSCVRLGMRAWPADLGLKTLDTDSVSEAEHRARTGYNGWRYVDGTHGLQPGFYADWKSSVLGPTASDPNPRHVTLVTDVSGASWKGIGAGTPSQKVAYQPASGGYNPISYIAGYFVPPTETTTKPAPPKPPVKPATAKPAPAKGQTYAVTKGDTVYAIARRFKVSQQALLKANPPAANRRPADFHISSPSLIVIGQKLHIPA